MVRTREQACKILRVSANASKQEIKDAYKALVKQCHPDVTGGSESAYYNLVVEAYDFLKDESVSYGNKIMESRKPVVTKSGGVSGEGRFRRTATNSDYQAFQKKMKKQKQQKAADFEKKQKEYSAKLEQQDKDYQRVMEAVEAIRAARAIEAMVWANGLGKDNNNEAKDKD